ncbi:collagenase [Aliikangiella coralliicola]|uniref:Collagenase n=1 Tax=Aliikangiella coralliicola TaxID=2592383 RepID=A0A545U7E0_9GAMM|nr:collagenase [Aliikangiella coralliicola]TQV85388.1 collagenase [Aliikangiella coralliicola]
MKKITHFILIVGLSITTVVAANTQVDNQSPKIEQVLSQSKKCSPSVSIRSQSLTDKQQEDACKTLSQQEVAFHQLFNTEGKPVKNDYNTNIRVNVYSSRDDYKKYASAHFNIPTDNGGMYLEGLPEQPDNQAEFITYERGTQIWNLRHEHIHYLDGRFNIYGDFCASLHDSHSPPEYCPEPAPLLPHTVWWSEGVAEYIANGDDHAAAFKSIRKATRRYKLSELFDTSYETNGGTARVYFWGYMAVRFMMENHREKIEKMLGFLRKGDFSRYQALTRTWGTEMDDEFAQWIGKLTETKETHAK